MKLLVNIEGNDGTGKHTVANKLKEFWSGEDDTLDELRAKWKHIDCRVIDFPAYSTPTGHIVSDFLNGKILGDPSITDAYSATLPFTLDRLAYYMLHYEELQDALDDEDDDTLHIIICNRSYLSNYFYQASKLMHTREIIRAWLAVQHRLEILNTPIGYFSPMNEIVNIYLTPADLSENLEKLKNRGEALDLNEQNTDYLARVEKFALYDGHEILDDIIAENQNAHHTNWALYYKYDIVMVPFGESPKEIARCINFAAIAISAAMEDKIKCLKGSASDLPNWGVTEHGN